MNIIIRLLDDWRDPERRPLPSKKELARRINVTDRTIQNDIGELEKACLVRREPRETAAGNWNSNTCRLDGQVKRIQKLEPNLEGSEGTTPGGSAPRRNALRPPRSRASKKTTPATCLGAETVTWFP